MDSFALKRKVNVKFQNYYWKNGFLLDRQNNQEEDVQKYLTSPRPTLNSNAFPRSLEESIFFPFVNVRT